MRALYVIARLALAARMSHVRQPTWKSKRAPRKRRAATNSPENPGDTGRIYGRARTGNFRGDGAAARGGRLRRTVDAHRGTCKFIRRENTSSTIEKSPACNGRFSLIGSSGHPDETLLVCDTKNIRRFLRLCVHWRFLSNARS